MKKLFSFCNIYILLWIVYNLQAIVFGNAGTTYASIIILFLTGTSLYYTFYVLFNYKVTGYLKGLALLLTLFTIYGIILILSGKTIVNLASHRIVANHNYIKQIYISLLPVFPFYVFTRKGLLTKGMVRGWAIIFLLLTILSFSSSHQQQLELATNNANEFTNNVGYLFLSIIPLLAFWSNNRIIQYLGLIIIIFFVLICFKRGAIIIGTLCVALFLWQNMKETTGKQKKWIIVLTIAVIVFYIFYVSNLLENSIYFNRRIEETFEWQNSDRNELYEVFWEHLKNETNPIVFLFGNGANATLTISTNYAHNDWLEIAVNQGLLGVFIYFAYWICFFHSWRKSVFDNEIYLAVSLSLIICFLKTLFSMSYADMSLYANLCMGFCFGKISEYEQSLTNSFS